VSGTSENLKTILWARRCYKDFSMCLRNHKGVAAKTATLSLVAASILLIARLLSAEDSPRPPAAAKTREALVLAFRTNLGYCQDWLVAKDFKSFSQSVAALTILSEAIGRHTAEAGTEQLAALRTAINELSAAAKVEDAGRAKRAIDALPTAIDAVAMASAAEAPAAVKKASAGFTPLMHLIDGTFTDAKTALVTGDAANAKSYAVVLAELGQVLALDRAGQQWHEQSADLVSAANEFARSQTDDPKQLRDQFHHLYVNCEACHQRR
jgi:hypothetical protein